SYRQSAAAATAWVSAFKRGVGLRLGVAESPASCDGDHRARPLHAIQPRDSLLRISASTTSAKHSGFHADVAKGAVAAGDQAAGVVMHFGGGEEDALAAAGAPADGGELLAGMGRGEEMGGERQGHRVARPPIDGEGAGIAAGG